MSSRSLIVLMALSFVGLFGLAWTLYSFLLALVLPDGVTAVATSFSEATQHRLYSVLPIAALGPLLLGGARFITGPASRPQRLALFASMLGCVGVATAVLWTTFSAPTYPTHVLDGSLAVSLPVTAVPLYQLGLAACGGIALAALFARLLRYRRG
jgi:hypothetical protein